MWIQLGCRLWHTRFSFYFALSSKANDGVTVAQTVKHSFWSFKTLSVEFTETLYRLHSSCCQLGPVFNFHSFFQPAKDQWMKNFESQSKVPCLVQNARKKELKKNYKSYACLPPVHRI